MYRVKEGSFVSGNQTPKNGCSVRPMYIVFQRATAYIDRLSTQRIS